MSDFGTWGSATEHARYIAPAPSNSRRHCHCGCGRRATHLGMANGVALSMGCELSMRRWVRDGSSMPRRARAAGVDVMEVE